jgi:hypothetical protein
MSNVLVAAGFVVTFFLLCLGPLAAADNDGQTCTSLWAITDADANGVMSRDEDKSQFIDKANAENTSMVKSESMTREQFLAFCARTRPAGLDTETGASAPPATPQPRAQ